MRSHPLAPCERNTVGDHLESRVGSDEGILARARALSLQVELGNRLLRVVDRSAPYDVWLRRI